MCQFKVNQKLLFKTVTVFYLKPLEKYKILFSFLDTSSLERLYSTTGRPPVGYESLLKALIYKNMKNISYFSDLVRMLRDHPDLALVFGFHPLRLPQVENFSAFLADTDNGMLQEVRNALVKKLMASGEIKGRYLAFDSTNIPAKVKENKLKTSVKDRFKKNRRPKGNPESRLGVMIHFPKPPQKEIRYCWGYRNFVLCDAWSELPIIEETRPANVVDSRVIIPQLRKLSNKFSFPIGAVIADSALDSAKVLSFIIRDLKAKPYIARNLRREKDFPISKDGNRICLSGFEMIYWGKYKEGKRTRIKFVCPIIHSKKFRAEHPYCPWMHPQFVKGTGCFAYQQVIDEDIRKQINYSSKEFKKIYDLHSGSERIFSRLLELARQNPSVRGLQAISNHCSVDCSGSCKGREQR